MVNLHSARIFEGLQKAYKKVDKFADFYCYRNQNKYGRFISILTVQGRNRSVIIISELALNREWGDIALKIDNIKNQREAPTTIRPRLTDPNIL